MEREQSAIEKELDIVKRQFTVKKMRRRLIFAIYSPYYLLRKVRTQLVILGTMFLLDAFIFMWYQGLDFLTALLGSVSTITTIGIYAPNIIVMDGVEKVLLIIVFVIAVGSAATLLQTTISSALKTGLMTEDLSRRLAKGMDRHVIVVGYKFLGKYMVEDLQAAKVEFIVVVKDEEQLEVLGPHRIPALYSPIANIYEVLKDANVKKAAILISTLDSDGENMLAVLAAKKLNDSIRTVSIVNDRQLLEGVKMAGADIAIPYFELIGSMLTISSIAKPAGIMFSQHGRARHVAEYKIETSGITYGDITGICPILMISRNGELISDMKNDFQLMQDDLIYTLMDAKSVKAFADKLKTLGASSPKKRSKS